jgi:xanthine dehydrogenase molybdenum-binding subunit
MSKTSVSKNGKYKVIGTRPIRHDGVDKVTGRALYGIDTHITGMLYGQILRSPHAHARIRSIDTSKAEALEGVHGVITRADLAPCGSDETINLVEGTFRLADLRSNILADEKVLYQGHSVAAVAATSLHIADEAVRLIEVDYEILPHVDDVSKAMQDDAPLLHEGLTTQEMGSDTGKISNVASHIQFKLGDLEKGFADSDVIVEGVFKTETVHQGYIESHNATAEWKTDGQLTIWTSTQGAFAVQKQTACILGIPVSKIKVVPMEIGGGFGGKISVYLAPQAAILSKKCGRPVKFVMNRADVFHSTGPTPSSHVEVKLGADKSGKFLAAKAKISFAAGAFPGSPIGAGAICVFSCYEIPNALVDGYDVVLNKPRSSAYRAPGSTQVNFSIETLVDEIAEKLGIDPVELRLLNASQEGTRRVDGAIYPIIGCRETLEQAKSHEHFITPLAGPNQGRGVATGFWMNGGLRSTVTAHVNEDGTVNLIEGSTDIGGSRTSIAMQFAEVLGIAAEAVNPMVGDTSSVGYTELTGGSRVTFATGWAAYEAAQEIKTQLIAKAAMYWEVTEKEVRFDKGDFVHATDSGKRLSFKELASHLKELGAPVVGTGTVNPNSGVGGSFTTCIADVEVDPDTGKVKILRFTVIQDAGTAIHPSYVEGQMQGGSVQGIGWALNEEYYYKEGLMQNGSFLDYRIPTCFDVPMVDTVIVEVPHPSHPFGVRGVGEASIATPPAAIANAINDAVGVRLRELPMRPDRVLSACLEKSPTTR